MLVGWCESDIKTNLRVGDWRDISVGRIGCRPEGEIVRSQPRQLRNDLRRFNLHVRPHAEDAGRAKKCASWLGCTVPYPIVCHLLRNPWAMEEVLGPDIDD